MNIGEASLRLKELGVHFPDKRMSLLTRATRKGRLHTTTRKGRCLTISWEKSAGFTVEEGWRFGDTLWIQI